MAVTGRSKLSGRGLPASLLSSGLGSKKVEMAGATFHEKKDYIFCLAPVMGNFRKGGVVRSTGKQRFIGKSRQCNGSKTCTRGIKKMAAVEWLVDLEAGHD